MSNVDSTQQPKTLEEAIEEIESLRSQLSGSDLKVFSQNRELRVENQKLKDEIRQLTEQCVTQTFKVRGLEKSEKKLQATLDEANSKISDLEGNVTDLQSKITELESEVTELGNELDEFRSKEIQLSQELERTLQSNSEALERALVEHSQEVEAKKADFEAEIASREKAIQQLEQKVEQFKEEFLSQELTLDAVISDGGSSENAGAFDLLSQKMEDFLGYPGRALVEQVFRLSGVETSSTNPSELEETFEVLQDTASQLVQNDEQEQELSAILESAWSALGLGEAAEESQESAEPEHVQEAEPTIEEPPVEAPSEEPVEESRLQTEEPAPAESTEKVEDSEVEVEVGEETSVEPEVAEAPTPDEPTPKDEEAETEGSVEDGPEPDLAIETSTETPEQTAGASDEPPEDEAPESVEEPSMEVASNEDSKSIGAETETSPEPAPTAEEPAADAEIEAAQEEAPEEVKSDSESADSTEETPEPDTATEVTPDFDLAASHLEAGKHAEALPIFELLQKGDPTEQTYQVGRLACLTGLSRFKEAFEAGKALEGADLGESREVFAESMEAALLGLANQAESELVKKEYLLELLLRAQPDDQVGPYLDEADEIPMRISREGELSLLQAGHRVKQDDVTEYLIDVLHSLHDKPTVFALLKTNLERYPELQPLSEFMQSLLDSPRAEALEAESNVRDLLGQGESVEDLLDETDPGEEAVVQVFLEHMLPRSGVECDIPSEEFEELMLDAEPAAFVGSLRQALRSVDYTIFFEEIEVLSYDGEEHFLLRSSPEPKPTLLFGEDLDDVPPEELRFLVLRELFSIYRRHSQLKHISAGLDDQKRVELVRACIDIFSEFESKVPEETYQDLEALKEAAQADGQDAEFRGKLEAFLREVYLATESDSFLELGDFLYNQQLNRKWLDPIADNFGAKQTGMVVASYAICRDILNEEEFEELEEGGFGWLYSEENLEKHADLRLRLQRLWSSPLKALISEPEE